MKKEITYGEYLFGKKEHKKQMRRVRQSEKEKDVRTINMEDHKGWGNSIYWLDYKKRELTGHLDPIPELGDKIICEMKSPNEFRHFRIYMVVNVEGCDDPPDQFFANVIDSGYIIETKEKGYKFEVGSPCPICDKKLRSFSKIDLHVSKKHEELAT